jgi:nucleoside phosphorylase
MKKTLIISPTIFEAEPIFKELGARGKLKVGDTIERDSIIGFVSGIGCNASAERLKTAIKKYSPEIIILAGFCGACDRHLKNGDLVYETSSTALIELAEKLRGTSGKIACVEKIADTTKKWNW